MNATHLPHCLTVPEYARRLGISPAQVRAYIDRGELEAVDTSERGAAGQRPRWKIAPETIERFERRRSNLARRMVAPPAPSPRVAERYV